MDKMDNHELISALADGQLRGGELARGVQAAAGDAGRGSWVAYHLIGDVMRSGRADVGTAPDVFLAKLQLRLQEAADRPAADTTLAPVVGVGRAAAANDWLWKLVAGVASIAAVTAIGWNLLGSATGSAGPQLATAPSAVVPVAATASPEANVTMIRDPRLDQLMAAHRQFGGATALQTPSGFLRNATFEGPAR